jgi:hypothetical protein
MARRTWVAAIVVPAMVAGWAAAQAVSARSETVEVAPGVVVRDGSPEDVEAVRWATLRFDRAGLELPSVEVSFHADRSSCRDNPGAGTLVEHGAYLVDVCVAGDDPEVLLPWTLLHELAHAWGHELTEERREGFLAVRGLSSWNDRALPWAERGTEHAAEIVMWALLDRPVALSRLPNDDCGSLEAAYEILTRLDLPEGHPGCPSWVR